MFLKVSLIGLFFSFLVLLYEVENAISLRDLGFLK
jgi:hypothetical protein